MSFTQIAITASINRPNGESASGTVTATLSEPISNGTEIIEPTPVVGELVEGQLLNQAGEPFTLAANNDLGTEPSGSQYRFVLALDSAPIREFTAVVPHTAPEGKVDITALEGRPMQTPLAELPAHAALETRRLTQIGMTQAELGVLETKYTTLQRAGTDPSGEAKVILEFFARLADSDLEEWLLEQRALGNFTGGRSPETDKLVSVPATAYIPLSEKGAPNGVASLNASGELEPTQAPSTMPIGRLSAHAQAQGQQTLAEGLSVTVTEEASTSVTNPVTIPALVEFHNLNPAAPWVYQQADVAENKETEFVCPLQPYVVRSSNGVFPYQIMFDFDGETFGVHFSNGEKKARFRIWANDVPSPYFEPKRGSYYLKINFGSRAQRRLILECDFNMYLGGIVHTKSDTISAPSEYATPSLAIMGDSFGRGSGILEGESEPRASSQSYAYTLARLLGLTQTRNYSVPGTGFCNPANTAGTYLERLAVPLAAYKPTVLFLQGSTNDHTYTSAEIKKAVEELVTSARSISPLTKIVGCTPMPISNATRTENEANAAAVREAFTALSVPFADGFAKEWIIGTGKVGATTGEGNSDYYSSAITAGHPSLAGHNYLALRLAQALAPVLNVGL
jgi:lysophospholipase L1-like esterase